MCVIHSACFVPVPEPWPLYLQGMLIHKLEQVVRFAIKGHGPMEEFAVAKSHPARLQLLIPAVHKTPGKNPPGYSNSFNPAPLLWVFFK